MATPHTRPCPPETAARLAAIAQASIRREYPNQIAHPMASDADAGTPRTLHPAFFGSYDWHSAVHGHWCLVRLLRLAEVGAPWAAEAAGALGESLTPANLLAETAYLLAEGRVGFERPYGLAWVLQLDAELCEWEDPRAVAWRAAVAPLTEACADRLLSWLDRLTHPVRTGVHSQSAFAMGLALDWARIAVRDAEARLLARRAHDLYASDSGWPLAFEPSGEDFLSPSLAEADLMRRVLPGSEFARWLTTFLPGLAGRDLEARFQPVRPRDLADGRFAHLDGLSLSRAWMLEGIAVALPQGDARTPVLESLAATHLHAGLASMEAGDYARAHWLATFAAYALTGRGLS